MSTDVTRNSDVEFYRALEESLYQTNLYRDYFGAKTGLCQTRITADMRTLLVDWMNEVANAFDLDSSEAFYLGTRYLDAYLGKRDVDPRNLQGLGLVCLWIGAKFVCHRVPRMHIWLSLMTGALSVVNVR
jgi:hypothetical protein